MLKKCTFRFLFTLLAMAGMSAAAYNGTPTAKENFATETINSKNCYKIGSAEDLYGFAAIVNGTNGNTAEPTACGVLTQNITVNENVLNSAGELNTAPAGGFIEWTPIGTSSTSSFKGSFNGQGHTISGLYFNNSETDNVGLFGYTSGAVTIDSVGVVDSYFRGKDYVGGLVGYHNNQNSQKLSVNNSYNTGSVNGANYVGGLVGGNLKNLSIVVENSYNTGSVNGSSNVGGLVGVNGNIYFSYNTGSVTGNDNVGGLVGSARSNQIIDCYNVGPVKEGDGVGNALLGEGCEEIASGMNNSFYLEGSGSECGSQSFSKTSEEFANGYVALELHNNTAATGASIWGQIVGADKTPLLTGEIKFLLNDGCFEIANEEDLYLFAAAVNNGVDSKVCAKLTADIKVNENVLGTGNANIDATTGAYAGSTTGLREWTPIGNADHPFIGTFDGDGHTISGLYFNDYAKNNVGLFGYVESSESVDVSIKNVGLEDSYFKANGKVGGVVGLVGDNVDVKIENVYNAAVVTDGGSIGYVGGIVGEFWTYKPSTLNILNSYNSGAVFGNKSVGGLVGGVDGDDVVSSVSVKNCYNYGALSAFNNQGETLIGSVVGSEVRVDISDTYYLENSNLQSTHGGTEMSSTQFADGTVLAALSNAEGGEVWRQYSGDAYPTFVKKSGTTFEPNAEGYYEIATADDLYKFAEIVNGGTAPDAKAKLMNDIKVNDYVLADANGVSKVNSDGAYIGADSASFRKWTPIGFGKDNENIVSFNGLFDGQGHSISGLYFNKADAQYVGLFGTLSTATIKNVGVEDSYFKGSDCIGGILGFVDIDASVNIENVYNAAVVVGGNRAGGIIGGDFGNESHVTNAYNVGMVLSIDEMAGGIVGYNYSVEPTTIQNSFNYGSVSAGSGTAGALIGEVDEDDDAAGFSVTNSFYLGDAANGDYGTNKSADDFANGDVFVALHSAEGGEDWLQYAGDAYPTLAAKTGTGAPAPMHVAVLHYSETDSVEIAYTEGSAFTLPAEDNSGNPIAGWTTSADGTGDVITEIPASATTDLKLYPKFNSFEPNAEGYYEIASADDLYKFAEIVNGGNSTAKAKLMNDIVVNENVLATAGGISNVDGTTGNYIGADSASFRKWIPIGSSSKPFKGTFDGQGFTISGLYCNGTSRTAGLFGFVDGYGKAPANVSIQNVGVEDSYFKAETVDGNATYAGGILADVGEHARVNLENVYSSAVAVASYAGGVIGEFYGIDLSVTNAFNVGDVVGTTYGGGLVGYVEASGSVDITNGYNYETSMNGNGALLGRVGNGSNTPIVTNSFYLASEQVGDYGTNKSADDFANGDVFVALHSAEGGYVWVQAPGDKYPTIDINATSANIVVLDWSTATDSTTLEDEGFSEGDIVVVKGGKQFYADGKIYEGILSADQVDAIGENKLYPISGVKLENVSGKLVATLNGNSDETLVIPTDIAVSKVVYQRDLTGGVFQTIMLPFDAQIGSRSDVKFYKFKEVTADYEVNVSTVKDKILANKPYIVVANSGITQIEFEGSLTLVKSTSEVYEVRKGNWVMKGVYKTKVFEDGDSELGRAYGFAGQQQVDTKIGEFVKVGTEAFADPMRVYLVNDPVSLARPGQYGVNSFARIRAVPKSLSVVIVDDDEEDAEDETMVVKQITVVPTVVPTSRWFDMKGRALNAKPTAKGTYYYNGQRVIIK